MDTLKFFGTGSAFNTEKGNNSAYIRVGTDLIILDMGGDVLPKMVKLNVLEGISKVHILITHMHGDHVGGLSNTILYLYSRVFRHQPEKICVYFPNPALADYLHMQGVARDKYTFYVNLWDELFLEDQRLTAEYAFEKTEHDPIFEGHVYGIDLTVNKDYHIFYSGDSKLFNPKLKEIHNYTAVYHETTMNPRGVVHFQYNDLLEVTKDFKPGERAKIHLMHLDADFDTEQALADGFSIVEAEPIPV
ncbi:MBL fold metallo-hydrolase [Anaerolentibacter hominis]|uniref:MBL fold metallo-hydrolase n=1 Tax=Anaerolentibacter hominis TaxID=3079009 RepID=UPI0031B8AB49